MAGKLSSRLTILEAITNAFSPTWDYDYEFVKGNSMTRTQVAGDSKLQVCSVGIINVYDE